MPSQPHRLDRTASDPPPVPPKPNTKFLSLFLKAVIMISITSLFFLLLGLASIILFPLLLSSLRRRGGGGCESSNAFSSKRIKKLPQFKFSDPTGLGNDSCVVCLDGFKQGQWCRRLTGCGHVFHRKCVDAWLVKVAACPICRARVCLEGEGDDYEEFWACFHHRRSSLLDFLSFTRADGRRLLQC